MRDMKRLCFVFLMFFHVSGLRWVGADTRWLDGLSIESIPQTIILSPTLEVHSVSTRLPSQGLGQVLIKFK